MQYHICMNVGADGSQVCPSILVNNAWLGTDLCYDAHKCLQAQVGLDLSSPAPDVNIVCADRGVWQQGRHRAAGAG